MPQWAIQQVLEQRYNLVLAEIERRRAFYDTLDSLKRIRLFLQIFTILFLMYCVYVLVTQLGTITRPKKRRQDSSKDKGEAQASEAELKDADLQSHIHLRQQLGQPVDGLVKSLDKSKGSIEEIANYSTSSSEEDDDDECINLFSDEDEKSLIGTLNLRKNRKN